MKKSLTASVLAVALAAGCSSAPPGGGQPTGSITSDIQGGTDDTTHTFAVGLAVELGSEGVAFCSGALLAPNLVATARHCAAAISSTVIDCATATFGADFTPQSFLITTDPTITQNSNFLNVSKVVTPPATEVCGNDLALLILSSNVNLPQYVTPILSPPMSDLSSEEITAIGYGIDSPTDDAGISAGTRRIRQDIPLACIPNDSTFTNCFPQYGSLMSSDEFMSTGGTCEGDSGSSAYDETSFDQGKWESFGVLSRGGVSADGKTCQGAIYTQFDGFGPLLISTALQAAQMGGYQPPAWTGASSTSPTADAAVSSAAPDAAAGASSSGGTGGAASSGGSSGGSSSSGGAANGASCTADSECASDNCITTDNNRTYFCASSCATSSDCSSKGFACEGADGAANSGYCIASSSGGQSTGGKSGCDVASLGSPTDAVSWRSVAASLAAMGLFARRRRRR